MNRAATLLEPWKRRIINKQTGLFVSICVIIGVIGIVFNSNPPVGVMLIFSAIFLGAFILIALNHDKQVTIIMIASAIALLLAMVLSMMNLFEGFSFEKVLLPTEPYQGYQEWEVLAVVFGMTLLVEAVSETGFFDWVIITLLKFSKGAVYPLFIITFLITLALSTVLANVTAMILIGSMILTICKGLDYNPTPFLMAAVLATALAGMATPVSSLPALLISGPTVGNIPFLNFLLISGPFIIICIPICILYLKKVYPPEKIPLRPGTSIDTDLIMSLDPWGVIEDRRRFYLAAVALGLTIIGFVFAQPLRDFGFPISIGVIAILGGVLAIILTRADEHNLLSNMGWDTLLVFAGLFILVGTLGDTKILDLIAQQMKLIVGENLFLAGALILIITGAFSGILDNIPVAAALIPVVKEINVPFESTNPKFLWYILVFSGAVGGGWTPFGSAAGILAVSLLSKEGRPLGFGSFIKTFVPICIILLVLSGIYLTILAILIGL